MVTQKKLRIVFVTNNYTPYSGGVVSSINAIADQLRKMGHKVFIITLDFLGKGHIDPYYVVRAPCQISFQYKKNCIAIPFHADPFVRSQIMLIKPDIIHVHHPFLLGKVACRIGKELGIPVFFTYHSLYEKYVHYVPVPQCISRPIVMRRVKKFCTEVNGIIVPSHSVYDFLSAQSVLTLKKIIPSPISPLFLTYDIDQKRLGSPVKLLCVSRFVKEKNLTFLLDVISMLPSHRYCLTVAGYGAEYDFLQWYAFKKRGLSPEVVRFVLRPSKDELRQLYYDAHLFLFSSISDTQGLVLAEAMAGGTPVIAIDGPGQRDIVVSGHNGSLVRDQAHMAYEIERISQSPDEYEYLSGNARITAQGYAPEVLADQVLQFYISLIL